MSSNTVVHSAAQATKGVTTIATSADKDKKRLRFLLNRIETAENYRDSRFKKKWQGYYKRYRNLVDAIIDEDGKIVSDRSNISIPYPYIQIETILPRLVESLFASRPYVTLTGVPKDAKEHRAYAHLAEKPWDLAAESMQQLLDHQHNVSMDLQDIMHTALKTMCLYGTTVIYDGWRYVERKVIRKAPVPVKISMPHPETGEMEEQPLTDDAGQPVTRLEPQESTETAYDDPDVKSLDLGLFYVDPDAEDIEGARYCGHVCYHTKGELQELEAQEILKIDWTKVEKGDKKNTARDDRMALTGTSIGQEGKQNPEDSLYEVHYYYEDDVQAILINRSYVAKDGANPFWHKRKPYVKDTYTKLPGEFYGMGIIEIIEDQHDELNAERNQRIDYRSMSLRRQFTQKREADISPKNWTYKNHGRILVDDHDDIKQLEVPSISGETFNQEEVVKKDMRDATGAQEVVMGGADGGTATEAMRNDNNAALRFKLIISSIEKRLLVGVSRLQIALNQQFIDSERLLDVSDDKGVQFIEITPEDIQGEFRLTAAGSSVEPMANKEMFKQRMVELFGIAARDPFYMQFPDKRRNLLKKVFEAFDIKDTDDLLPSDEEIQQMMAQMVPPQPDPQQEQQAVEQQVMEQQAQQEAASQQEQADKDRAFQQQLVLKDKDHASKKELEEMRLRAAAEQAQARQLVGGERR